MSSDRRSFLSSLGVVTIAGLVPSSSCAQTTRAKMASAPRGLAPADDFLFDPGLTYLNTGSLGPTPRPVMDRTIAVWKELERNPAGMGYGVLETAMEQVRAKAAAFIGCKTEELVLTTCTTQGMNWVAEGLVLAPGDRILTTDQEHPGGRACWDFVARRSGAVIDVVAIPPGENDVGAILERFMRLVTPKTRVMSFSHLLSSTGLRMPVTELCALAKRAGCISIVDGAQAVGAIEVNVKAIGCDVYATSGHKWLLGPKGTGFLYLSEELGGRVDPIALQGGRAAYSVSSGVCSIPSVHGLAAALEYVNALGIKRIEAHNLALGRYLFEALKRVPNLRVVSAAPGPLASPLLTYELPATIDIAELHGRLRNKHNIEVKEVPRNWLNGHRISTHLFSDERDVDKLAAALKAEFS